jgi:hypothetical protein
MGEKSPGYPQNEVEVSMEIAEQLRRGVERHVWQAHVEEEVDRIRRAQQPLPSVSHWAEEYAARATRWLEATENEYERAEGSGERHTPGASSDVADASDIAGG